MRRGGRVGPDSRSRLSSSGEGRAVRWEMPPPPAGCEDEDGVPCGSPPPVAEDEEDGVLLLPSVPWLGAEPLEPDPEAGGGGGPGGGPLGPMAPEDGGGWPSSPSSSSSSSSPGP